MVLVDGAGERTMLHNIGADAAITAEVIESRLAGPFLHVGGALVLPGLDDPDGAPLAGLFERAQAAGIHTSLDVVHDSTARWQGRLTLNPVVIFLAVIFWGWLWGVPGALLAVPFLVILKSLCENVDRLQPIAEFLSGAEAPPAVKAPETSDRPPDLAASEAGPPPVTTPPPGAVSAG